MSICVDPGFLFIASTCPGEVIGGVMIDVVCPVICPVCKLAPDKPVVEVECILVLAPRLVGLRKCLDCLQDGDYFRL